MAARETGIGAVETFMHAGKLLALDLLVKVLQHQGHTWSHVRQEVRLLDWRKKCKSFLSFLSWTFQNFAFHVYFYVVLHCAFNFVSNLTRLYCFFTMAL